MRRTDAGFSLVELLVAMLLVAGITAATSTLSMEALGMWRAQGAGVDVHQRARAVADQLRRAMEGVGAGASHGVGRGPLVRYLPPVVPRRVGARGADAPDTFREDAVSLVRVDPDAEPAVLLLPAAAGASLLQIAPDSTCGRPSCGLTAGSQALLVDRRGGYDLFTVVSADGAALSVEHLGSGAATAYAAGAPIYPAQVQVFSLDERARTLRRYDGAGSDVPVADDLVEFRVSYEGTRDPPLWPQPPPGVPNCLYGAGGSYGAGLLPALGPGPGGYAPLDAQRLADGPWCGAGDYLFDADLLRVRRIRVALRLQAADPAARGSDRDAYANPGTATRPGAAMPDVAFTVDVVPRNLRIGW